MNKQIRNISDFSGDAIVVLTNGFVFLGTVQQVDGGCVIAPAYNLRQFGTDRGLGQLVHGPRKDTKADPFGVVTFPHSQLIMYIDVAGDCLTKFETAFGRA